VVTVSADHTAKLWDVQTGACALTLEGHTDWLRSAAFSPDSQLVATASKDATARLWSVESGRCVLSLEGHGGWVRSVAFTPCGPLPQACAALRR